MISARRPILRPWRELAFNLGEAAVENVYRAIRLLTINHERRHQTNRALSASEDEQAQFERALEEPIANATVGLTRSLIFDQLDSDHQAAPADMPHEPVLLRPVGNSP